jgi:polyhydroxybutyrate depolymerase
VSVVWRAAAGLGTGVLTLLAAVLVVLVGQPVAAQWAGRTQVGTLEQGPLERHYRVYRPASLEARPGLVIDLHGAHTGGFLEEVATRFDAQADRHGWVVAYPEGVADGWEPFGCCRHAGVDDVAFIAGVIDRLEASDRVDPDRVYVTGLSRGGMMAYRLACQLSPRLAAIAPVAGNMADENGHVGGVDCRPQRPVSVLSVHGSADAEVPIAGGGRFAPLEDVVARWRELDACASGGSRSVAGPVTATGWRCRSGTEVRSVVIQGAGHTWPGTPLSSLPWAPAASLDASATIAEFFATHRRAPETR